MYVYTYKHTDMYICESLCSALGILINPLEIKKSNSDEAMMKRSEFLEWEVEM
ncbi:hypothetical protein LguiB_003210 [Lonicera macranthoides]